MTSIAKRPNGKWRARYRDPSGKEHSGHFARKVDAEQWLAQQVTKVGSGTWVDPLAGRRTFAEYARGWLEGQIHHRASTTSQTRSRLETHLIPTFGARPIGSIQRSEVQAWVTAKKADYQPTTVEGFYRLLAQIMGAAVHDRVIASTPCWDIKLPEKLGRRVRIPTEDELAAIASAASRYGKRLVLVVAGTGLRVSEIGGLTADRVDFLRRTVTVDRQILGQTRGVPRFGPPKTKASNRTIPVPESITVAMSEQLALWPTTTTLFLTQKGQPWTRSSLGEEWRGWCERAGVEGVRFHDLRHFYASSLIAAGQSPKVVQERLGHSSPTETLHTYSHLWPSDEEGTRTAVEDVVGPLLRKIAD